MHALTTSRFSRGALPARVTISFFFALNAFAQETDTAGTVEVERVIVTGSSIPTAEETGPDPVDTYRPADLEKLGIRSAQDFETFLPQEAGSTVNLNIGNGGDGSVQINLRGLLPKETLILIDGKRVAFGSLGVAGFSQGQDINLIPFSMVDHVDILKDGASAVYGSDAVAGVINFFCYTSFGGWKSGAVTGTQIWEHPMKWASGRLGLKRARVMTRQILWS
jgi:iron complex outermembrane receptor protein